MKKILFTALFFAHFVVFGQERKDLVLSVGLGVANLTPNNSVQSPSQGTSFSLDFDYYLGKRHVLSMGYYFAHNTYYYDYTYGTNYPKNEYQNSDNYLSNFGLCYKFKLIDKARFSFLVGTGLYAEAHIWRYPVLYPAHNSTYSTTVERSGNIDLGFLFRLETNYWISSRWAIGLQGGVYYKPQSVVSSFIQPKISFCIK